MIFSKLLKNKKAQNTAEYAILISLVVSTATTMQAYVQRSIQGRVKDASNLMTSVKGDDVVTISWKSVTCRKSMQSTQQYEPYYLTKEYEIASATEKMKYLNGDAIEGAGMSVNSTRSKMGGQTTLWNATLEKLFAEDNFFNRHRRHHHHRRDTTPTSVL
ncbi:MAG: hypothetical protein HQL24_05535 [Candidatus Omnitrophica bacterium]|nr:hypothetical protein [Candidatus Omnitrophota bacterium]